jgi:small multidrug resistance pump
MGKSLLTKDKTEKRGECMWGLPVLRILLVRAHKYAWTNNILLVHASTRILEIPCAVTSIKHHEPHSTANSNLPMMRIGLVFFVLKILNHSCVSGAQHVGSKRVWSKWNYADVSVPTQRTRSNRLFPRSSRESALLIRGGGTNPGKLILTTMGNVADYVGSSKSRCWAVLVLAMLNEIVATSMTKSARDTGSPTRLAIAICLYVTSLLGFASALAKIDVSIAYACWSATGTALVSVVGITLFGEEFDVVKILCISLILVGVIGLNLRDMTR